MQEIYSGKSCLRATALGRAARAIGDTDVVKADGEDGTTPAPACYRHAFVDALRPLGVRNITMAATPFRAWQAIEAARAEG